MMIKIKITACCIILLSFIFFLYPVEVQSMVSPDSGKTPDSTASLNSENITIQQIHRIPRKIPDSTAHP